MDTRAVVEPVVALPETNATLSVRWIDPEVESIATWELVTEDSSTIVGGRHDGAAGGQPLTFLQAVATVPPAQVELIVAIQVRIIDTLCGDLWAAAMDWDERFTGAEDPPVAEVIGVRRCTAALSDHIDELAELVSTTVGIEDPQSKRRHLELARYPYDGAVVSTVLYGRTVVHALQSWARNRLDRS